MKKEKLYLTPTVQEFEIRTEGILCESGPLGQNSVDAGFLDENEW